MPMRWAWIGTTAVGAIALLLGSVPAMRAYWSWRESNPVRRGAEIARRAGCLSCHGPDGTRGLPDPGTRDEVPAWDGGIAMMYVNGEEEVREFILDGVSRRRAAIPSAQTERSKAAIRMPAYRSVLREREVEDLVAYFMAASMMKPIDETAASRGRDLVRRFRCESCHGLGGSGGVLNPGSYKGYVPGWLGADYAELVGDESELRQWIHEGGIERLANDRLAIYFLARQRLQMPAYKAALSGEETDAIVSYLKWLRKRP
jgi:mono/diheme cytochrome c family protein